MKAVLGVLCAVWLVVGGFAGDQRDLHGHGLTCAAAVTAVTTVAAGPLNDDGTDPALSCPEPS